MLSVQRFISLPPLGLLAWMKTTIHASKPRGGSEINLYTLRGKTEENFCNMKDDGTCKNNWSWLPADYLFNFLTFICKDQICSHAFLICNKTVSKVKHHVVCVIPKTWEFVSLSPESFQLNNIFLFFHYQLSPRWASFVYLPIKIFYSGYHGIDSISLNL